MNARPTGAPSLDERKISLARQVILVLLVCGAAFWVRLGADGLSATEGFRAIPAWEMLASGDYLVPTLHDQAYLRKPPGMAWAIAGSSMVFGETEFAARFVSALASTIMAVMSLVFARRWIGPRYASTAGIAFALTPWFWQAGRSAEIEALNNLFIQTAVFLIVDRLVFATRNAWIDLLAACGAGLAIGGAMLTKGPIGLVFVVVVAIGACLARRSVRPIVRPMVWISVLLGLVCFSFWFYGAEAYMKETGIEPVTQSVGDFLWNPKKLPQIILLGFAAFFSAFPMSFALLFPFGRRATSEFNDPNDRSLFAIRTLTYGCVLSLVVLTLIGLSNQRYAMPAFVFVPPLVAYVVRGWAGNFESWRRASARIMLLGRPVASLFAMLIVLGIWVFAIEPRRDARSGREAGEAIAVYIPDGSDVLAHHLVEARPEVLWYARKAAARDGKTITTRWIPGLSRQQIEINDNTMLLLRTDEYEATQMKEYGGLQDLQELESGKVHKYTFGLFGRPK